MMNLWCLFILLLVKVQLIKTTEAETQFEYQDVTSVLPPDLPIPTIVPLDSEVVSTTGKVLVF